MTFDKDLISAVLSALTLLVACIAAVIAFWQIRVGRSETRSAQAHNIYQQYLAMCMANPIFAEGGYEPKTKNDIQYAQYTWFISSMLFAFEQILEAKPSDQYWKTAIKEQLLRHRLHLSKSKSIQKDQWHPELFKILQEVLSSDIINTPSFDS